MEDHGREEVCPRLYGQQIMKPELDSKRSQEKRKKKSRGRAFSHYASVAATPFGLDSVYGVVSQQHR